MSLRIAPIIDRDLIRRFDVQGPRYTSYPTADRFVEAHGPAAHAAWLARRRVGGIGRPLSVYVHLPFCASICYYCACNKVVTRERGRAARYLDYLERETALVAGHLGLERRVVQLHLGGGTPTFHTHDELAALMAMLRRHFDLEHAAEVAIEVDPRSIGPDTMRVLAGLGFNRCSIGVQDVNPAVQRAIHRVQSPDETLACQNAARAAGFGSINFDLIYGLPRQTAASFAGTLDFVCAASPDRIALYGYAHLPERFKPQRRIAPADLPGAQQKLDLFCLALERLTAAGYVHIGLDHFAKPGDELAAALRAGRLHRNFQGYTTRPEADLVALGVSAISRVGPTYSQNVSVLADYYDSLDQERLPVARGIELSADDLARRAVITALMCQGEVDFESVGIAHLIDFPGYFAPELAELAPFERAGLVDIEPGALRVAAQGRLFLRAICMPFDRYLRADRMRSRYSRVL